MELFSGLSGFIDKIGFTETIVLILTLHVTGAFKLIVKYFRRGKEDDHPHRRKDDNGDSHSHSRIETEFTEVKHKLESVIRHHGNLEKKVEDHLIKEALEDVMFAEIKADQAHLKDKFNDLKEVFNKLEENQRDAFHLIGEIKNTMIERNS